MGILDALKSAHSFVTDGYKRYQDLREMFGGLSEKEQKIGDLIKRAGVKVDNIQDIHNKEGGWGGLFRKLVGTETFQHSVAEALVEVGTAVATEGFTPALAATIAISGSEYAAKMMGNEESDYRKGSWVLIDDGVEVLPEGLKSTLRWGEAEMFGEMPDKDEIDMETDHLVSVGFVVEPNNESGKVTIFNLEYGESREYWRTEFRHLEYTRANGLEENDDISAIKAFILDPDAVAARLACEVPCDPGEEVEYEGDMFKIVSCNGIHANIENGNNSLKVKMDWLTRGRVDHTNSWNYTDETPTGFDRDIKARLHKGMWIWLPVRHKGLEHYPQALKEMGMLRLINGENVDGYYASDGERFKVHEDMIHPLKEVRQEWLNRHQFFKIWRANALIGEHNVRSTSLGNQFGLICYGLAKFTGVLTHGTVEEGHVVGGATQGQLLLGAPPTEGGRDTPGETREDAKRQALGQEKEQEILVFNGHEYEKRDKDRHDIEPKSKKEESNSYALMACVAGIGILVLYSTA